MGLARQIDHVDVVTGLTWRVSNGKRNQEASSSIRQPMVCADKVNECSRAGCAPGRGVLPGFVCSRAGCAPGRGMLPGGVCSRAGCAPGRCSCACSWGCACGWGGARGLGCTLQPTYLGTSEQKAYALGCYIIGVLPHPI